MAPSSPRVCGIGQLAMPLPESLQVNVTVTSLLCQPAIFAAGETLAVMVGAVLSIFSVWVVTPLNPALSSTVPSIVWPAPSAVTFTWFAQVATPEPTSKQLKLTVTSVLFQPAVFGLGIAVDVMVGGLVSILIVTVVLARFPAISMAVPVTS